MSDYHLLFKTAQAEFRCWNSFSHPLKNSIIPIVEFTRGRKRPKAGADLADDLLLSTPGVYDFDKNVEGVISGFAESSRIFLDLTREDGLQCYEISRLAASPNGYSAWLEFCQGLKVKGLHSPVPTIIVNPSPDEDENAYRDNIRSQTIKIFQNFGEAAYRASIRVDTDFVYDLECISDIVIGNIKSGRRFTILLDHEYVHTGFGLLHSVRTGNLIKGIRARLPGVEFVILATSFPRSVTELGGEDQGSFPTEETLLYREVLRQFNDNTGLHYGDYGSINPVRNDQIRRGGWRPRIDFPMARPRIIYYREKMTDTYKSHYRSVALKLKNDPVFREDALPDSWGYQQIIAAAEETVPSSSPTFWISVRMEIFLHRQLNLIKNEAIQK